MRRTALLSILAFPILHAHGQSPTWADDVACIVYSHCTSCHHPGAIGGEHLDLMTYAAAALDAESIAESVQDRSMPPWPPDQAYRALAHARTISQEEIDIIAAWAAAGAPEGEPGNAPPPPVYTNAAEITAPDVSVIMDEYVIPPISTDLYRCFVLPTGTTADHFIQRLEVIPGNRQVVHHVLVYQDTTGQAAALDAADIDPGYTAFGGIGVNDAKLIGIWVPGSPVLSTPAGMGIKLFAGADLVIQVHYPADSDAQSDSTRVNIAYAPPGFTREIAIAPALDHLITITDGPLIIPPNEVRTFHAQYTIPIPVAVTAVGPHAHLLGRSMRSWAITPAQDSVPLISIPDWDFHWQGMYEFRNPVYLPAGTVLHGEATYDNTTNNPENPNDPPNWVFLGEGTTDEMMLFYFAYTFGFPSDTLIVVDDGSHPAHHADCTTDFNIGMAERPAGNFIRLAPMPATDHVQLLGAAAGDELLLRDLQGRLVMRQRLNGTLTELSVGSLARGPFAAEVRNTRGVAIHRSILLLQ
ncbi:MAG: hypothetical protein U0U25_13880 [Flavobacteriales bacterium]